jgi:hypothetical protein
MMHRSGRSVTPGGDNQFMKACTLATAALTILAATGQAQPLYESPEFTITGESVTQGPFTATALSRDHIVSTIRAPPGR